MPKVANFTVSGVSGSKTVSKDASGSSDLGIKKEGWFSKKPRLIGFKSFPPHKSLAFGHQLRRRGVLSEVGSRDGSSVCLIMRRSGCGCKPVCVQWRIGFN